MVDAATGSEIPVFDMRDLLRPTALPAGYTHIYDAVPYEGWGASCSQLFADAAGHQLWVTQAYGRHWPDDWTGSERSVVVRHAVARVRDGEMVWIEGGRSFELTASDSALSTAALIAVADSLEP